jgi:mannan endo-1,4-beta-mannosidase
LPGGLSVHGTRLLLDGRPWVVSGMNYWAGPTLARDKSAGWDRVRTDLDDLQALGITMVRVMAASEGPDTEPLRVVPSIQPAKGRYDSSGLEGVARFAEELRRRRMTGIFALNNFWPWSGGMAQYVSWAGQGPIPYPPPVPGGNMDHYLAFTGRFYEVAEAREAYRAYIRRLVPELATNPAVIWELANEPRGLDHRPLYVAWIDETARLIKSLAPGQLVTTGSEGETAWPSGAGLDVVQDHQSPAIDFITCHLWAQNWGWVHTGTLADDFAGALERATQYVRHHAALSAQAGKPVLLEEFGFPRDGGSFAPDAPTSLRDRYFAAMYELVASLARDTPMAGILPWAWSGRSLPPRPGEMWRTGDPLLGDPPHEPQGWYGIYGSDTTSAVIRAGSASLATAGASIVG